MCFIIWINGSELVIWYFFVVLWVDIDEGLWLCEVYQGIDFLIWGKVCDVEGVMVFCVVDSGNVVCQLKGLLFDVMWCE